ncbi:MAG: MBOAT family protein [Oscillospiraceae bacterium]|nr:MBOAT family protein [Oscillospiraceae bacterium]
MVFSNPSFLYYFLPITLVLYFLTPMPKGSPRLRNLTLLVASLVFYAWGEPKYVFLMAAQCVAAWGFGLLIDKYRGAKTSKVFMLISVIISFSGLLFFKYFNFFISNINSVANSDIPLIDLLMPIGISFYTFQITSYTFDLYRGNTEVQRNVLYFSTYVTMFPQLIAGPIVRYVDIARELGRREHTLPRFAVGARRFVIGLGKKMLLANMFGELVSIYKQSGDSSVLFAWLYAAAYALQVYFDFSAYSDMAIGLGHILGFKFLENFNYPYIADSITNFWRRWHMSLSSWFRDYVYIPLGGNRVRALRFMLNIMVVWMLTGFWHGAEWNFILWGGFFGIVLLIEKFFLNKVLNKTPKAIRHVYVMLIVLVSWVLFDAARFSEAFSLIGRMFGAGASAFAGNESLYYLRSYAIPLIIGIVGSTPLLKNIGEKLSAKNTPATILEPLVLVLILTAATAKIVDGSFNPFIYFRF